MSSGIIGFIRRRLVREAPPIHPIDRKLARQWIKRRLIAVFPELRNNPAALEEAYQQLDLEPRANLRANEPCFELMFHDR